MLPKIHVLIPSAGTGSRFGSDAPKQFHRLHDKLIIEYSLEVFFKMPQIDSVWVGLSAGMEKELVMQHSKLNLCATGGATRSATVLNTLELMQQQLLDPNDWVLVHDAARPGIQTHQVQELITAVLSGDADGGILALPITDTLKRARSDIPRVDSTLPRDHIWQAQTPQMFQIGSLYTALLECAAKGHMITDEASAMEYMGIAPLLIKGSFANLKITYPEDLQLMEKIIPKAPNIRIGQGYDVHRLVPDRKLILGGVVIPFELGLLGHSDADVLLHAITDAMIGAAGLGDIGKHFPDTDPYYKNANSMQLLEKAHTLIRQKGFAVVNIDATIICQAPKLASFIPNMVKNLSEALNINSTCINIKAKTNEGLGYLGDSQAIEAQAVVLLNY